jgi:phosphohistidine phosphatase
VLLRHGKSAYPPAVRDHDRPLAPRGRREAALAGRWLVEHGPAIDAVLCSTATRTRQTLAATGLTTGEPTFSPDVYEATPGEVLEQVRATDEAVGTLLVVGHAPGLPGLALALAGPDSEAGALDDLRRRFPTSAVAVLTVPVRWADLDDDGAALTAFTVPRT